MANMILNEFHAQLIVYRKSIEIKRLRTLQSFDALLRLTTIGEHLSPLQAFLFPVEFPAHITLSVIVAGLLAFSRHCTFEANSTLICWST